MITTVLYPRITTERLLKLISLLSGRHASSCWQFNFPEKHRVRTPLNDVILMTHSTVMSCCHKARSSWPVQWRLMDSLKQEGIRLTVENKRKKVSIKKSGILVYLRTQCICSHHMQFNSAVSLAKGTVVDCSVLRSHPIWRNGEDIWSHYVWMQRQRHCEILTNCQLSPS